ncbi:MAG: hypothetical protein HYY03_09850 [Chloroflexi bacterium]|nr:hypothetical protein [Chloroflexota bacterium]
MKEQGRADELARAIEELLQGHPAPDLHDEDLNDLLRMARVRRDAARAAGHASAQHEGAIWQQLLARLGRLGQKQASNAAGTPKDAAVGDPEMLDFKELEGVIDLRRQMAEHSASLAEVHRDAVWKQVQARIQDRSSRGGLFFLPHPQPEARSLASAVDNLVLGEPIWEATDSRLEDLLDVAHTRRAMGQAAALAGSQRVQGRLWARLRPRLLARLLGPQRAGTGDFAAGRPWPKLAAAAATLALVLAALGPIPATGFADHPATQLVRLAGRHLGVTETSSTPAVPPVTDIVEAGSVSAAQASEMLGLPARQPTFLPDGFQPVSAKYFPQPLTASEGGVFLLAYAATPAAPTASPPTILIYQERASGTDVAAQQGSAQDLTLSDGTRATYVEGSWMASADQVVWGADGSQTLLFDRDGLRTIVRYDNGPRMEPSELAAIAEGMAVGPG